MSAMQNHQREDILRLPITLTGKTAQKWIEIRKEHGIGDQDFADLLMHRYEATSHLFVPVASSSGSSTTFTFNGPIGVSETASPSSKPVKKRGRPPKQAIIIAPSPPKPLQKEQPAKKTAKTASPATPRKVSSKMAKQKSEDASSEDESSESGDSGSNASDSDDSNTVGTTSEDYNPSGESANESEEEGGLMDGEDEEEKAKKLKYERDDGEGVKRYDAREVAKVEGVVMPKIPPRPRAKLQRKYWPSLTKQYHCKLCPFESPNPKLTCQHLLQQHGESVGELREYLLGAAATDSEPGVTLLHLVMAEKPPAGADPFEKVIDSTPSGQSNDGSETDANRNVLTPSFEGGFGLTRSEAAQTLANVADSLVTVAQLQDNNNMHVQSGFQRGQLAMGQLPSDVAQAQLEMMQRQLDAAHGLTHPPGAMSLPPGAMSLPPGAMSLHMNIAENAFSGGHRQLQEFGIHSPMLIHQSYPTAMHPQPDVEHHHGNVPRPHQFHDPLVRSEGGTPEGMKNVNTLQQGSPSMVLTSQGGGSQSHLQTVVSESQMDNPQPQKVIVQQIGHFPSPPEQRDIPERTGDLSEPPKEVVHSEETETDPLMEPKPTLESRPQAQGEEQKGAMTEGDTGAGEEGKESEEGTDRTQTEEKDHSEAPAQVGENVGDESGESKTDGQTEEMEEPMRRRTRSASKRKYVPPPRVQAKRGRGRPKGACMKKAPEMPPEKEDPFDEIKFLQILLKWVKIMVSCPTCGKSLHNLGVINKKGVKISHVCRTTERKSEAEILCHLCGKSFMSGRGFKVHWQEYHGNMERAVCQFCGKVVKGSYLSQHINRCHTETGVTYQCAMCGKAFKSKSACDKHEVVHRTEKPHKCPYCGRGFTQQANMKHHMRQHTGEQPYRCETCAKSFTHNVSLKNHLKRQHGVDLWQMGHTGGGRPKKEKPVEGLESEPLVFN